MKKEHLTIVQLARFGDLIQTSPLLVNLKDEYGIEREITLVVDKRTAEVAEMLYGVDKVIKIDLNEAAGLISRSIIDSYFKMHQWAKKLTSLPLSDRLILLNEGSLSASIASLIPAKVKEGPLPGISWLSPHRYLLSALADRRFNPLHISEIWAAYGPALHPLSTPLLKDTSKGTGFALIEGSSIPDLCKYKCLALNLGAGAEGRRYPAASFAVLTRFILRKGDTAVILLGTPENRKQSEKILGELNDSEKSRVFDLVGRTKLKDLPGILNSCDILISSDTGTLQLAAATKVRSIGFYFNGAYPGETGCFAPGSVALVANRFQQYETGDSLPTEVPDPEIVADIAWKMLTGQDYTGDVEDASGFHCLVARSDDVAIEYVGDGSGGKKWTDKRRRWADFARTLLWWNQSKARASSEINPSRWIGNMEPGQVRLISQILSNSISPEVLSETDVEELTWLKNLITFFPDEISEIRNFIQD